MYSLPFHQHLHKGGTKWHMVGILTVGSDGVGIEWRSDQHSRRWGTARHEHEARGAVHHLVIPWTSIDSIAYHGSIFGAGQIRICARTMGALDKLPGSEGPFWSVRVGKLERSRAREFSLASEEAIAAATTLLGRRTRG